MLLAVSLMASCGRDPDTVRVETVAQVPGREHAQVVAHRRVALTRWFQVQWWGAVERWSWVTTVHYAAAYDQAHLRVAKPALSRGREELQAQPGSGRWAALAQCESSGNWSETKGSFEGGLQFSNATWLAYGGGAYARHAYDATPAQQIAVAERVLASQGPSAWPVCSWRAGFR